jgi:hypothetical protein
MNQLIHREMVLHVNSGVLNHLFILCRVSMGSVSGIFESGVDRGSGYCPDYARVAA